MDNEKLSLSKYASNLEHLLIQSVKNQAKFRRILKNKLKNICLLLVDKGIKPDEIVKCINNTQKSEEKIENFDFSDDSEEEAENTEKELYTLDDTKKSNLKNPNDDTEYDSDLNLISKKFESDDIFDFNHAETVRRLKKYFEKNRKKLKENKTHQANPTNIIPSNTQANFYSDSISNIQNESNLLNKKRYKN